MAREVTAVPDERSLSVDVDSLSRLLDGRHHELRERIRALLSEPRFAYPQSPRVDAYRELVLRWCRILAREGLGGLGYPIEHGGGGDVTSAVVAFETIAFHDLSLLVKFGVQFGLFGGAIANLGRPNGTTPSTCGGWRRWSFRGASP